MYSQNDILYRVVGYVYGTQSTMNIAKLTNYVNKNSWIRYWDDQAKVVFLKDDSSFITYEDDIIEISFDNKRYYLFYDSFIIRCNK